MIIFRYKQLFCLAFFAGLIGACSDKSDADSTFDSSSSKEAEKICEHIAEQEKSVETGSKVEQSVPDYKASDIIDADKDERGSSPSPEYYEQLESDIKSQEVDRRLRQLEQNAEVRKAEENARRANERVNSLWRGER